MMMIANAETEGARGSFFTSFPMVPRTTGRQGRVLYAK